MDVSSVDLSRMAALVPEGVRPGSDVSSLVTGVVVGLDIPGGLVQVTVGVSDPVWVPAAPFIYEPGARVRLRRSPLDGGRLEYCEGPIVSPDCVVTGLLSAIGSESATVDLLGDTFEIPFAASTYSPGDSVLVLRHPSGFGVPQAVLGVAGTTRSAENPGGGVGNPGQQQSREAYISAQASGSYRTAYSRWDTWNTDRYGGVRALWQGNSYGSGPMVGWAGYGDQVANLRADAIDNIWVDVVRSDSSVSSAKSVVLQGSPSGTRPSGEPAGSGATVASPGLTPEGGARIRLPDSTYEAWRTGGIKGLRTSGSDYLALYGWDRGGAMVLTVQYRVTA